MGHGNGRDARSIARRAGARLPCLLAVVTLAVAGATDRGDPDPSPASVRLPAVPAVGRVALVAQVDGDAVPDVVLTAYRTAERALAAARPRCRLSWALLAGVGRVESGHAAGGRVDAAGTTRGRILGVTLNGTGGVAAVPDTDRGRLDGDTVWDRAVGPMQFIPATWRRYAADGNGDAVRSPHNVHDAALAAGRLLCAGGGDLSRPADQRAALLRYNRSEAYVDLVLRWTTAYTGGVAAVPGEPGPVPAAPPSPPERVPAPAVVRPPGSADAVPPVAVERPRRDARRAARAQRIVVAETALGRGRAERIVVAETAREAVRTRRAASRSASAARVVVEPAAGAAPIVVGPAG